MKGFARFIEYLDSEECDWLLMSIRVNKQGSAGFSSMWSVNVVASDGFQLTADWERSNVNLDVCFDQIIEAMIGDAGCDG